MVDYMNEYYVIGLDIGSATAKAVLIDNEARKLPRQFEPQQEGCCSPQKL
jgi:activator of 2-hydroxyglutaryl-CoA dehydratase